MSRSLKLLLIAAIAVFWPALSYAASSNVNSLTASGAIVGTQLFYCPIGASTDLKCSAAQIAAYNYSLMSGDCTASGTGAITCTKTNGTAFGTLATLTPGTGVATALGVNVGSAGAFVVNGGALGTPSGGTLTNATGLPIAGITGLGTGVGTALAIAPGTTGSFSTQDGVITTGDCLMWGPGIQDAGAACGSSGGGITFPQTVAGTTNSGGIPYFSAATTLSSSATLAANSLVMGGGAGVAPSTITTGTGVLTALGVAVNGSGGIISPTPAAAGDIAYWNGTTWVKLAGNNSGTQYLSENASGAPSWGSGVSAGVSSFSTTCPTGGPSTGAVTISNFLTTPAAKTGSYNPGGTDTDCGSALTFTITGAATYTLPTPSSGFYLPAVANDSTSTANLTIAPPTGVINGASTFVLLPNQSASIWYNGTAWYASPVSSAPATNVITVTQAMSPYTYTPTTGMKAVDVYCLGGGGGGGSGAITVSGTASSGGAGGSSSIGQYKRFTAAQVGASITVTIGAGGAGGIPPAAGTASAGGNGTAGGNTTFGSLMTAGGGGGSAGGQSAAAAGSGASGGWTGAGPSATGSSGASITAGALVQMSGVAGNGTTTVPNDFQGGVGGGGINGAVGGFGSQGMIASGGGAGGGVSTTPAAFAGNGSGRVPYSTSSALGGSSGGGAGATGPSITGSLTYSHLTPGGYAGGSAGGGGGSSITVGTAGGAGGVGDLGSGGGGGGSTITTNTAQPGAGGAGGNGQCAIVELF